MTGGQMAPTTVPGQKTTTTPAGRDTKTSGHPLRVCELLATIEVFRLFSACPSTLTRTFLWRKRRSKRLFSIR